MTRRRDRAGAPAAGQRGTPSKGASQAPREGSRLLDELRALDLAPIAGWLSEGDLRRLARRDAPAGPGTMSEADGDGSAPRGEAGTRRRGQR
jgi:hypothetical protein